MTPGAARYPDLPFPDIPEALAATDAATRHEQAWNRLQAGDLRGAEREFKALASQAGFYPAEAGLGYVNIARKDFAPAVAAFDRALAVNPAYVPALLGKGEALLGQDEQAGALDAFERALAASPDMASVRSRVEVLRFRAVQEQVSRAQTAARAGRLDEAEAAYERAITASPESGFLYRELAGVEQQRGDFDEALAHARKAIELDRNDAAAHAIAGAILEGRGEYAAAAAEFETAASIEGSAAYRARALELRRKITDAALPPEYRAIPGAPSITRAQLAALFGLRLEPLLASAPQRAPVVMTDIRDHWANTYIQRVTRARIMDAFPNHTFQPDSIVRRGDFAQAVSRALNVMAARRPGLAARWRGARPSLTDVPPGHLAYPAVSIAVASEVMTAPNGQFDLTRPITGAEAIDALARLQALAR
ncbi:MAG: S-layer homology domain-containing protein [Vicinamibacterales bacterium]